ncbi:hypothetical protein ACFL9T_23135 [Thermodesulfobacteriota bacterium]
MKPKLLRKAFSIFCYTISGFFLYIVSLLAFIKEEPIITKYAMMGGFFLPALVALGIGLAFVRFKNWKRDSGIIFMSVSGFMTFIILVMFCVLSSPQLKPYFPDDKMDFFSNYRSGLSFVLITATIGLLLIWNWKKSQSN